MEGRSVAFKKQLTPPRMHSRGMRGNVTKQRGKGSTQQDDTSGGETVTGGSPLGRMMNQYPKPPPPVRAPPVAPAGDQAEYDEQSQ